MTKTRDFWVGDRFVRPSLGEIQLGPERVHLEPRSMEVLLALTSRPGEVFPKEQLIGAVWGEAFVSDEVLTHAIWDLRRAFGDNASDPEFIQTIPKRGYRLIAPVKPVGRPLRRATDRQQPPRATGAEEERNRSRSTLPRVLAGLTVVVALIGLTFWAALDQPADEVPPLPPAEMALVLVSVGQIDGAELLGPRLDGHLASKLIGLPGGVVVRTETACRRVPNAKATYCLEPRVNRRPGGYELNADLRDAATGDPLYSSPIRQLGADDELAPISTELADLVSSYFEVERDSYSQNPDIRPWISLQRHDPRAVKLFLLGMKYVFRHETGGGDPMADAMRQDPDFIAPWVLRTPATVKAGDEAAIAAHKASLKRLRGNATGFERAMIDWALALIDNKLEVAVRQLWVAQEEEPGNGPVLHVLGALLLRQGDLEGAWGVLDQLLGRRWDFPGLYPLSAHCALLRGKLDDFSRVLALGETIQPIDPETLAQLQLLALYRDDAEKAETYRKSLATRMRQMKPENVELEFQRPTADHLAARAEAEGRAATAARIRESVT